MIKKSLSVLTVAVGFLLQAQDFSVIKNTSEIYSNASIPGTSKYNAMAGSMGALGSDISMVNSNPAGIGVSIANDMNGTLYISNNKNGNSYNGNKIDYNVNTTDIRQIGGITVIELNGNTKWKFINLGFNYASKSIEDYSEAPANTKVSLTDGTNSLTYQGHAFNRLGSQNKMSFAIGSNYNNNLYLGLSLNFTGATLHQDDSSAFTYSGNNTTEVFSKQFTPYDENSQGFNFNVGVIGKVSNQFRLGAAIETPTWWSIERAYSEYDATSNYTYAENRNFRSPMKATISAAYVLEKALSVNLDYNIGLTKPKFNAQSSADNELNSFLNANYKSVSEVKLGAEYRIKQFRIRAGYAFAGSPYRDNIGIDTYIPSTGVIDTQSSFKELFVGKKNTIGFGLGYNFRSFYIDAAYQNISSSYKSPSTHGEYFSNNYSLVSNASVLSDVRNTKNNYFITLGWRF